MLKPVSEGILTAEVVDGVDKQIDGLHLQDTALQVYADNTRATLRVLSGTLALKAGDNAPDGTDDEIKKNMQKARADARDVARYCAQ